VIIGMLVDGHHIKSPPLPLPLFPFAFLSFSISLFCLISPQSPPFLCFLSFSPLLFSDSGRRLGPLVLIRAWRLCSIGPTSAAGPHDDPSQARPSQAKPSQPVSQPKNLDQREMNWTKVRYGGYGEVKGELIIRVN